MHKSILAVVFACILAIPLFAQYSFNFTCLDDTIQEGIDVIEFYFLLENTGSLPDSYAFDCRVIDSVPGWLEQYCIGAVCAEPGVILYDYLDVGESDSTIKVQVFPTPGFATEILNLHVQSVGNPSLQDSINVYAVGINAIQENEHQSLRHITVTVNPNPFSRKTDIRYEPAPPGGARPGIPKEVDSRQKSVVSMKIYDATGRLIKQFPRFTPDALHPTHISWDGSDDRDLAVPAGIYFIQLEHNGFKKTTTIIRLK
jgi:hypothetical protein